VYSSYATANGAVYIGSDDNNLYALDASTGAKLWSYATGSAVQSSAAVANGVVYVGSNDGNVYALNAGTGAKLWSYATGGGFPSPAVVNGVVYVGSGDGNVYAFGLPAVGTFITLSPTAGHVGATAYIQGSNLTGTTGVSFNGVAAKFSVLSSSKVRTIVPAGATTGPVSVVTPNGTLESTVPFRVLPQTTGFTPTSGPVGTVVTIAGIALTQTTAVSFDGVPATSFSVISDTELQATVPEGAKTGYIEITTAGGTWTTCNKFTVAPE